MHIAEYFAECKWQIWAFENWLYILIAGHFVDNLEVLFSMETMPIFFGMTHNITMSDA